MDTVSHITLFQGHIIFGDKEKKYNQVISHSDQLVITRVPYLLVERGLCSLVLYQSTNKGYSLSTKKVATNQS